MAKKIVSKSADSLAAIRARIAARKAKRTAVARKSAPTPTPTPVAPKRPVVQVGNDRALTKALADLANATKGFNSKLNQMDTRLKYAERFNKARNVSLPGVEDGGTVKGQKVKFSFVKAIRYLITGREDGCEFEAEVFRQSEKRAAQGLINKTALEAGTDSIGGFLVPQQIITDLIDLIRANAVMIAAGATSMSGLTGSPVQIPKQTSGSTGYWVAENGAPTESNQAFGQVTMTPHTAAGLVKISKRLIMQATPAAEGIVRADLAEQLALLIDLAILRGSGAAGQPIGIANWPGVLTYALGTNGDDLSYDHLVGIQQKVRDNNGLKNSKSVAWVMSTALIGIIQRMVDANNRPLFLPWTEKVDGWAADNPGAGGPVGRLFGYPVFDTTQIPTNLTKGTGTSLTELYFGDMATVVVGQWGGVEISASDQTSDAFAKRQVWVQIAQEVDVALRQEARMCYVSDIKTT